MPPHSAILRPNAGPSASRCYAFLGYGELGRQLANLFLTPAERAIAVFFDDVLYAEGGAGSRPFADYSEGEFDARLWIIGLGYKHLVLKERLANELLAAGRELPVLLHDRAYVDPSARLEAGSIVYPMVNIDQGAVLGVGALLNNSVIVSHDSVIGPCAFLSPGVVLAGRVRVGARCFLGAGSVVADQVSVGDGAVIGIGTVVTRSISPATHVIGNPARTLSHPLVLK